VSSIFVCCLLVGFVVSQSGWAQQKSSSGETTKKAKQAKPAGRLPDLYRQAGISVFQRKQIYDIQKKYRDEITALRKQLKELESKRDGEIEALLSDRQKADLIKLKNLRKKPATSSAKPKPKSKATTTDKAK